MRIRCLVFRLNCVTQDPPGHHASPCRLPSHRAFNYTMGSCKCECQSDQSTPAPTASPHNTALGTTNLTSAPIASPTTSPATSPTAVTSSSQTSPSLKCSKCYCWAYCNCFNHTTPTRDKCKVNDVYGKKPDYENDCHCAAYNTRMLESVDNNENNYTALEGLLGNVANYEYWDLKEKRMYHNFMIDEIRSILE